MNLVHNPLLALFLEMTTNRKMFNVQIHSTVAESLKGRLMTLETLYKRCAGLDVHSETIVACVLIGDNESNITKEIETFPTLTKDLFRLLKWLKEYEVTHIAMESTGDLLETSL